MADKTFTSSGGHFEPPTFLYPTRPANLYERTEIVAVSSCCDLCGAITGMVPCPACGCMCVTITETHTITET